MSKREPVATTALSEKVTERDMLVKLNGRYGSFNGNGIRYARAEHVKVTPGFDTRRICDFMAMDLWPGGYGPDAGPKLHGHEVKVSRADWLTELKQPEKAEAFRRFCDFWWLVVSDRSIVRDGELPIGWGLMVASGHTLRAVVKAERISTTEPLPRDVQATLLRATTKTAVRLDRGGDKATGFIARRMNLPEREVLHV